MIQNQREYRISNAWKKRFERNLETLEQTPLKSGQHLKMRQAQIDATRSQIEDLGGQLSAYDGLREHQTSNG